MSEENKGWVCPICGVGLAPWKDKCDCVEQNKKYPDYPLDIIELKKPWSPYSRIKYGPVIWDDGGACFDETMEPNIRYDF